MLDASVGGPFYVGGGRDQNMRPADEFNAVQRLIAAGMNDAKSYSYLLGLYLGDGCISRHPRAWRLRIVLDDKYPKLSKAAAWPSTL
jgi:hypothetical protein